MQRTIRLEAEMGRVLVIRVLGLKVELFLEENGTTRYLLTAPYWNTFKAFAELILIENKKEKTNV